MRNVRGDVNREGLCIHIFRLNIYKYGDSMSYSASTKNICNKHLYKLTILTKVATNDCLTLSFPSRDMCQVPPALAMPQAFEALDHSDLERIQ